MPIFSYTITAVDKATAVAQKVNRSIAQVTKPISDVRQSVAAFSKETGMDKLGRSIEKVGIGATETARRVASIAPPLAAITGLGTLAGLTAIAASWGKQSIAVRNTAYNLGIGTTQLQEYQGAARLAGLSSEAMTSGMKSLGAAFEDVTAGRAPELAGVLNQFGIGVHRLKNGSIDVARAMHDISNAAAKLPNAEARNKFLGLFGAEGLAPLLGKGATELDRRIGQMRALNATMTPQQIAQGEQYNEAMVGLDFSMQKLGNSVGASLAPAFTQVSDALVPIANEYGPRLAHWIESIDWGKAIASTEQFVDSIGGMKTIAAGIALITFAGPISSTIGLATQLLKLTTVVVPGAIAALGTLGAAGLAAWGALKIAKLAGLPDTDVQKGIDDIRNGRWGAASTHLPAADFISAVAHHAYGAGQSNAAIANDLAKKYPPPPVSGVASFNPGEPPLLDRPPVAQSSQPSPVASTLPAGDTQALFSGLEQQYQLPSGLLDSVYQTESARGRFLTSPKGAQGPFQFMPATARQYGLQDPMDLRQSATAAAHMYSDLLRANGGDVTRALAAYNWGQGNLNRYGLGNAPGETRNYIDKVMAGMGGAPSDDTRFASATAPNAGGAMQLASTGGRVEVALRFENAPKGLTAHVRTHGNVIASTNIGRPGLTGVSV